jgi:NADPH-dependent 2,4-dienoyl-CoA reductase/sulfur reductase-like enzyme
LDNRIVIVGAGEAGVAAAEALREGGYQGEVLLLSAEPVIPYERPPLSKEILLGIESEMRLIRPGDWYESNAITLLLSAEASAVDPDARIVEVKLDDGATRTVSYDKLLLATGGRPRRLPSLADSVFYLRTQTDCENLRSRLRDARQVAVIGGGVIGLEVAAAARELGKPVTVVDLAPRLMARAVAPPVSDVLKALHEEHGVEFLLGAKDVAPCDGAVLVDSCRIDADLIVAGIGICPNTELAEQAGCHIDNGIVVDGAGRTSVPGIYAAGDVAAMPHPLFDQAVRIETWQHAGRHGAHVAQAMMGADDSFVGVPWFWTDQYDVNLQMAGSHVGADNTVWRGDASRGTAFHFADRKLLGVTTINNGRDIRPSVQLIEAGWRGDPELLTDPAEPLQRIVKRLLQELPKALS